jgi:hypothetical protein
VKCLEKTESDGVISDLDQGIRLDPKYAVVYVEAALRIMRRRRVAPCDSCD